MLFECKIWLDASFETQGSGVTLPDFKFWLPPFLAEWQKTRGLDSLSLSFISLFTAVVICSKVSRTADLVNTEPLLVGKMQG
jgi:hypothetical protein